MKAWEHRVKVHRAAGRALLIKLGDGSTANAETPERYEGGWK